MNIDNPIVIVGSGRSGSTIFFEALSNHPDLAWITNYDSKFPNSRLFSLHHYLRRSRVLDELFVTQKPQNKLKRSIGDRFLVRPEEAYNKWRVLCDEDFSKDFLSGVCASRTSKEKILKFYGSVLNRQGRKRIIIKITGPTRMHYLTSIFPKACFVHVKRDPRAVASSTMKTGFWQESLTQPRWKHGLPPHWESIWGSYSNSPIALFAMQYKAIMDNCEAEKKGLKDGGYFELSYNEFVQSPASTLESVMEFTGLPISTEVLNYANQPGRYKDMDWKYTEALSADEIAMIEEITGL